MKTVTGNHKSKRKRSIVLPLKKITSAGGTITKIPTIDSEDPDFGLKLEALFKRNVARALKEKAGASKPSRLRVAGKN